MGLRKLAQQRAVNSANEVFARIENPFAKKQANEM